MKKSILTIVNSNALNAVISTVCKQEFDMIPARNYGEAFYFLRSRPDIAIAIIHVPGQMSENKLFLDHISTSSLFGELPVIILAESTEAKLWAKTEKNGSFHFMSTPFDPVRLLEKAKELTYEKERLVLTEEFY